MRPRRGDLLTVDGYSAHRVYTSGRSRRETDLPDMKRAVRKHADRCPWDGMLIGHMYAATQCTYTESSADERRGNAILNRVRMCFAIGAVLNVNSLSV